MEIAYLLQPCSRYNRHSDRSEGHEPWDVGTINVGKQNTYDRGQRVKQTRDYETFLKLTVMYQTIIFFKPSLNLSQLLIFYFRHLFCLVVGLWNGSGGETRQSH